MPFLRRFACCVSYTEPIQIPLLKLQNARQTRSLPIFSTFSQYAFAGVLGPYALVLYSADCSEIFAWLCLSWLVSSCPWCSVWLRVWRGEMDKKRYIYCLTSAPGSKSTFLPPIAWDGICYEGLLGDWHVFWVNHLEVKWNLLPRSWTGMQILEGKFKRFQRFSFLKISYFFGSTVESVRECFIWRVSNSPNTFPGENSVGFFRIWLSVENPITLGCDIPVFAKVSCDLSDLIFTWWIIKWRNKISYTLKQGLSHTVHTVCQNSLVTKWTPWQKTSNH